MSAKIRNRRLLEKIADLYFPKSKSQKLSVEILRTWIHNCQKMKPNEKMKLL